LKERWIWKKEFRADAAEIAMEKEELILSFFPLFIFLLDSIQASRYLVGRG